MQLQLQHEALFLIQNESSLPVVSIVLWSIFDLLLEPFPDPSDSYVRAGNAHAKTQKTKERPTKCKIH